MAFSVDQKFFVTDKTDGKKYPAKVVAIDGARELVRVHFIDWKKSRDEWLNFDSERIHVGDESEAEDFFDPEEDGTIGAAMGRLLLSIGVESRQMVSKYDIRLLFDENCRNLNKFKVTDLEACAADLRIKTKTEEGKKIFKHKLGLSKAIVSKIKAHLPHMCIYCEKEYTVELNEDVLYECLYCGAPSHSCDDVRKVKSYFPNGLPTGFVWLCGKCNNSEGPVAGEVPGGERGEQGPETSASLPLVNTDVGPDDKQDRTDYPDSENRQKKLCKYYVYKRCKHGAKGKGCQFDHPKKCLRYIRNGDNKKRGCTRGKQCPFFHPPLCNNALRTGFCDRAECRFHHIKGTKLSDGVSQSPDGNLQEGRRNSSGPANSRSTLLRAEARPLGLHNPTGAPVERSYTRVTAGDRDDKITPQTLAYSEVVNDSDHSIFSELRREIQQMKKDLKLQMSQQFKKMKMNSPQQTTVSTCRCRTQCH